MKVDGRKTTPSRGVAAPGELRPEAAGPVAEVAAGDDRVEVSARARELAGLRQALGDVGAIRQEKVAALRVALAGARHGADPSVVAEAVLREIAANLVV